MRKWALYILLIILQLNCSKNISFAQTIFYQDICNCGVTTGGLSTGLGIGNGVVNLHIEQGSMIKKAILFTYSTGLKTSEIIKVNNVPYQFDSTNIILKYPHKNIYFSPIFIHYIDITNELITSATSSFQVSISNQQNLPFEGVFAPYIYIVYENPNLLLSNTVIVLNEQNLIGNESYAIANINPINNSNPVSFSIYTDRSAPFNVPNCDVYFNGNLLGTVGGSDNVNQSWSYAGVKGHFYYQNNQLFGLDDDTPDTIMSGTDGLADVSSYILNNSTSCSFRLTDINYPNQPANATNVNLAYFLTYTSPCDTFSVSTIPDTTICQGSPLQLYATGGTKYEWQRATEINNNLSCTDCANPVFMGDSSTVYTVRIWSDENCSIVRPVHITVLPKPKNGTFSTVNTQCGEQKGVIKMQSNPTLQTFNAIAENGDTLQSSYQSIPQVSAGNYTVFFVDTNGCKSNDSLITVESVSNVIADFTITPTSGTAPLSVTIDNTSQNATNYQWSINGQSVGSSPTHFDTSGTYIIQLVAWDQYSECADKITKTVFVYDSLMVRIPNVFTPNGDGVNDVLTIQTNLPVHATILFLNRWGNIVFTFDQNLNVGNNDVWNGETKDHEMVSKGTYFYKAVLALDSTVADCEKQACKIQEQGFITVMK